MKFDEWINLAPVFLYWTLNKRRCYCLYTIHEKCLCKVGWSLQNYKRSKIIFLKSTKHEKDLKSVENYQKIVLWSLKKIQKHLKSTFYLVFKHLNKIKLF